MPTLYCFSLFSSVIKNYPSKSRACFYLRIIAYICPNRLFIYNPPSAIQT